MDTPEKTHFLLSDLLDTQDIILAWELYRCTPPEEVVTKLCDDFVRDRIEVITERAGRPVDAKYMTYMLIAIFQQVRFKC